MLGALVAAVEALRRSGTYFTSKVAEMVRDGYLRRNTEPALLASKRTRLTFRERQLVQLLAEGKSTRQAALALGMSVKTAEPPPVTNDGCDRLDLNWRRIARI